MSVYAKSFRTYRDRFWEPRQNGPINEDAARVNTRRNWREFDRCERERQWTFRLAGLLISLLIIFALFAYFAGL